MITTKNCVRSWESKNSWSKKMKISVIWYTKEWQEKVESGKNSNYFEIISSDFPFNLIQSIRIKISIFKKKFNIKWENNIKFNFDLFQVFKQNKVNIWIIKSL